MVCHITYKDENGKWLFPEKKSKELIAKSAKVQVGKIEKDGVSQRRIQLTQILS